MVTVEVKVEKVHQREQMADMERARRGIDAGVHHDFLRIYEGIELPFRPTHSPSLQY